MTDEIWVKVYVALGEGTWLFLYKAGYLVLHPDIHDACAMLDAASNVHGKADIPGLGKRVVVTYKNYCFAEYTLWVNWRQS